MRPDLIYKIFRQNEWAQLQETGTFSGSAHDRRDGFIHLSTVGQLQGTLDKHYTQRDVVILAEVETTALGEALKYEISRGGAAFPHLYGMLLIDNVSRHWVLSPDAQGRYCLHKYLTDEL